MLKTEIWVKGYVRQCDLAGLPCVIVNRGAPEAGAVYICVTISNGHGQVYSPAPGPAYDGEGGRNWETPLGPGPVSMADIDAYLARQLKFDPDIWIIEVQDKTGLALIRQHHNRPDQ